MNDKAAQHAPVPYKVVMTLQKAPHGPKGLAIQSSNGLIFADFRDGHGATRDETTIQFIVRACNSHYDLLEACKLLMQVPNPSGQRPNNYAFGQARDLVEAAITKAEAHGEHNESE